MTDRETPELTPAERGRLAAWRPAEPGAEFADRVVAAARARRDGAAVRGGARWVYAAAAAAVLALATLVAWGVLHDDQHLAVAPVPASGSSAPGVPGAPAGEAGVPGAEKGTLARVMGTAAATGAAAEAGTAGAGGAGAAAGTGTATAAATGAGAPAPPAPTSVAAADPETKARATFALAEAARGALEADPLVAYDAATLAAEVGRLEAAMAKLESMYEAVVAASRPAWTVAATVSLASTYALLARQALAAADKFDAVCGAAPAAAAAAECAAAAKLSAEAAAAATRFDARAAASYTEADTYARAHHVDDAPARAAAEWLRRRAGSAAPIVFAGPSSVVAPADELAVVGGLDKDSVAAVVRAGKDRATACYDHVLRRHPEVGGAIKVRLTVLPTGGVEGIEVTDSSVGNLFLESCIRGAISTWRFPRPTDGGKVLVVVTLDFVRAR